jgi:hypothetical protein
MKKFFLFGLIFCIYTLQTGFSQIVKKNTVLLNKISLTATGGFEVDSAFLEYEDGSTVATGNQTELNKKIVLWIIINKGWTDSAGRVKIGAAEKILTDKGIVILNEENLFPQGKDEGSVADARYISLNAVITSVTKKILYFKVLFKVWDKRGTGKISGSYIFTLKQDIN